MKVNHKELIRKMIIDINDMEDHMKFFTKGFWDKTDCQKETIASYLEQENVKDDWAKDFLKKMEVGL